MCNPRVKKLYYCMCLMTMKQWSRWSLKEGVLQWDMSPEPTELLLTGCLTESIWIQRFKPNTSTPNTNSQTYWQREISHVVIGTIFSICSTSAISAQFAALRISAQPAALKRWRKGCKNRKETTGSWQSQSRRRCTLLSLSRQVL